MPQTPSTPHRVAVPGGGDTFMSHEDYIDHLYSCKADWIRLRENAQAALIARQILRAKTGPRHCPVCLAAQRRTA